MGMAWEPARRVSGEDWMAPFLGNLLRDPYHAVRYIAVRSLRTLPGFEGLDIDYASSPETRSAAVDRIFEDLAHPFIAAGETGADEWRLAALLISEQRELIRETFARLLRERDDKRVILHRMEHRDPYLRRHVTFGLVVAPLLPRPRRRPRGAAWVQGGLVPRCREGVRRLLWTLAHAHGTLWAWSISHSRRSLP